MVKNNSSKIVIHITGYSGSGKTTIGKKIEKTKKYDVYDTDDVSANLYDYLIKKSPKLMIENEQKFYKEYFKLLDEWKNKILKSSKNIVIVGFAFDVNELFKKNNIQGYILDVDKEVAYKRSLIRDLDFICRNKSKLMSIINNSNVKLIDQKIYNVGLHQPFPPSQSFSETFKRMDDIHQNLIKKFNYSLIKVDELINKLK